MWRANVLNNTSLNYKCINYDGLKKLGKKEHFIFRFCWLRPNVKSQHDMFWISKTYRGKSGVRINLVKALNVQWTSFTAKSEFQMMTTDDGFHLKSGFKKIWWPQEMVLVLILVSRKYCVHQRNLYWHLDLGFH